MKTGVSNLLLIWAAVYHLAGAMGQYFPLASDGDVGFSEEEQP